MLQQFASAASALALTILTALIPTPAHAWGDEGHMIVALIAYRNLTSTEQSAVDRLLASDADSLTKPDIASRATWADRFRDSDRNSSKQHYNLTREWHFVDIELDQPNLDVACFGHPAPMRPASLGPAKACVVDRINAFAAELATLPAGDPEKGIALKFLLHLVGDIHQPLHAADHHDQGGNQVLVLFGRHKVGQKLHGYWDKGVVLAMGKDPALVSADIDRRLSAKCTEWMAGSPSEWARESFAIAKDFVYQLGASTTDIHNNASYVLTGEYQDRAKDIAEVQLEKAGCRLAKILKSSLH